MSALAEVRALGVFREPPFALLSAEHVPFDTLTRDGSVERPLREAVVSGSSAAVTGPRGGGKSSVLAWLCAELPDDHIPIRVPVVGMNDPSDRAVMGSVALAAALEAALAGDVDLSDRERGALERSRSDELTAQAGGRKAGAKLGGGPIPAEVSTELESLRGEYTRAAQPVDRLFGFERLLGIFNHHGLTPVFVLEDTEAAVGVGVDEVTRDRFFTVALKMLVREIDTPVVIAVQEHFVELPAYTELRPYLLEVAIPVLTEGISDALHAILRQRLKSLTPPADPEAVVVPDALPQLAALYGETGGSIRHVLAALDVAATAALDSGADRIELGHIRRGIEDWRGR